MTRRDVMTSDRALIALTMFGVATFLAALAGEIHQFRTYREEARRGSA